MAKKTYDETGLKINYFTDEERKKLIAIRQKWEMEYNEMEKARKKAKQEAMEEEIKRIVKEMHKNKMSTEVIIKVTKLTTEEVEEILNDNE